METVKRDTTWFVKNKEAVNMDSLVVDVIHTSSGDSLVLIRQKPTGLKSTAERSHTINVKVKHTAPIGGSPVGHMVFGEDTLGHGIFDSQLSLDGTWLPINGIDTTTPSDNIKVGKTIFEPVKPYKTHIEVAPVQANSLPNYDGICQGVLFALVIMAFPYLLLARLKKACF
jgi:hypothetical protein